MEEKKPEKGERGERGEKGEKGGQAVPKAIIPPPITFESLPLPGDWNDKLNMLERIIFYRFLRSDMVIPAIKKWISIEAGEQFIIPPLFDLSKCFKDSTALTPLIFILSPGSDPISDFVKFAED